MFARVLLRLGVGVVGGEDVCRGNAAVGVGVGSIDIGGGDGVIEAAKLNGVMLGCRATGKPGKKKVV